MTSVGQPEVVAAPNRCTSALPNGMITGPRRRLIDQLRPRVADGAAPEMENTSGRRV